MQFYIAFSIHGTNTYIVATNNNPVLEKGMKPVISRNPEFNKPNVRKIHYDKLNNKNGEPTKSASIVMKVFKDLRNKGWNVDDEKFKQRHFSRQTKTLQSSNHE